ncbi:MAG: TerC family protein [Chrysiogenetes bacterium]|nr:TerC family protein [Chrysiogenetes bacterium]
MEVFLTSEALISLATLTALEIVLGIDNIVFISILTGRLPKSQQGKAQKVGLALALLMRLGLLLAISWIMGLTEPLLVVLGKELTGRSLILLGGGLFLIAKSTHEIYEKLEVEQHETGAAAGGATFGMVLAQIMALDMVFSLDSVITAVGMVQHIPIMVAAMVIAVGVMMSFARAVGDFVNRHPSMKILALSFLLLIGVMLVVEALDHHVNKGYIYFAMAFSLFVELLNMRIRKSRRAPVKLHQRFESIDIDELQAPSGA